MPRRNNSCTSGQVSGTSVMRRYHLDSCGLGTLLRKRDKLMQVFRRPQQYRFMHRDDVVECDRARGKVCERVSLLTILLILLYGTI